MFYPKLLFFFFNDTATTEIYTLSLHDALPISVIFHVGSHDRLAVCLPDLRLRYVGHVVGHVDLSRIVNTGDRKSTRLNSSHQIISYAVFCLKKKKGLLQADQDQRVYHSSLLEG